MLSLTQDQKRDFCKQRQSIITHSDNGEIIVSSISWEDGGFPNEIYIWSHSCYGSYSEYLNDLSCLSTESGKKYIVSTIDEDDYMDKLFSIELI